MLLRKKVLEKLHEMLGDHLSKSEIEVLVERPTNPEHGDLALPCFALAKELKKAPNVIAEELVQKWVFNDLGKAKAIGPYLNLYFDKKQLIEATLNAIMTQKDSYGLNNMGNGEKVVVDYCGVNVGKPMHVGHIRSTITGACIINVFRACGYNTYGINYLGDVGLHIGKLIYAIQKWGNYEEIEKSPIHEFLNLYVKFCKEEKTSEDGIEETPLEELEDEVRNDHPLTIEAKSILRKIEDGEQEAIEQWHKIINLSNKGFEPLYKRLGVEFDEITGQSHFGKRGKQLCQDAVKKGGAKIKDGAIKYNLDKYGLPEIVVLRSDGTALYSTQDIGAAFERYEKHRFSKCIYVVGAEQKLYFEQIFAILKDMRYAWADNCIHIPFGLLRLEEGRISTREGNIVFLEEVLDKAFNLALDTVNKKNPGLPEKEKIEIAEAVGIGSVKYMILSVDTETALKFSWKKALNMEDNSAPYIQYTFARANSLLRKANEKDDTWSVSDLDEPEVINIIRILHDYPFIVQNVSRLLKPHILANYINRLAGAFNKFYNAHLVIGSDKEASLLTLVKATMTVINNSMKLLGIDLVKRM